jgi:aminopeptidase-like protein
MADGWKRFESFPRKYSIPKVDSQVHSAPMLNRSVTVIGHSLLGMYDDYHPADIGKMNSERMNI